MKRLIVLCDGTGQSSYRGNGSFPSNVKILGDCLAQEYTVPGDDDKHPQIIYYQSGVATASSLGIADRAIAAGMGMGIDDNILDAYYFLCNNYLDPSDEIYLFGFSRGAFTARMVANLVVRLGLIRMNVSWMIRRAWAQYMKDDGNASFEYFLSQLDKPEFRDRTRRARVKVLGLWDTVGAVGLPDYDLVEKMKLNSKNEFYDTRLHWGIENVFHALGLDECRLTFGPTLFYLPTEDMKPEWFKEQERASGKQEKINLRQCWFAGSHSDVGGGYVSNHQSNIALAWMIDNCLRLNLLTFNADTNWGPEHVNMGRKWKKTINGHHRPQDDKYGSHIDEERQVDLVENEYPGWGCGVIRDSFVEMTGAVSKQFRLPGNYAVLGVHPGPTVVIPKLDPVRKALSYLNPLGYTYLWQGTPVKVAADEPVMCGDPNCKHPISMWDQPGGTNETIHASVFARFQAVKAGKVMKVEQWNPRSLQGFRVDVHSEDPKTDFKREACAPRPMGLDVPYVFKWRGTCCKDQSKYFEMYEEPDDYYKDGLMEQLRVHDEEFWKKSPLEEQQVYAKWLDKNFKYTPGQA